MGQVNITRRNGSSLLNLPVKANNGFDPNNEEGIFIHSALGYISDWAISNENPFLNYEKQELIFNGPFSGYLSDTGSYLSPNGTRKEVTYANNTDLTSGAIVTTGAEYKFFYQIDSGTSQALALYVNEFDAERNFLQRVTFSATGTYYTNTYIPTNGSVRYITVSIRTFGSTTTEINRPLFKIWLNKPSSLTDIPFPPTKEGVQPGTVWIQTHDYGTGIVNYLDEDELQLKIAGAYIYNEDGDSQWHKTGIVISKNGSIIVPELIKPIYTKRILSSTSFTPPDYHEGITGGWACTESSKIFLNPDSILFKGGVLHTIVPINTKGFKTIEFDIVCTSSSATTKVGIGTENNNLITFQTAKKSMTEYETLSVDISNYQGFYYVNLSTTATSVGCYVSGIRLIG